MFFKKNDTIKENLEENRPKDIIDYILEIQQDMYLVKDRLSNIEYEMKKINPNFTKVDKDNDILHKILEDFKNK